MAKGAIVKKVERPTAPTRASRVKTAFRTDKVRIEKLSSIVTVYGDNQIVEVPCFIINTTDDHLVVRQKARAGSSKQVIRSYPRSKVAAFTDTAGDLGILHVITREAVLILKDQSVSYEGLYVVATDNKSGEVTRINTECCTVEVSVEDENVGAQVASKRPAKAAPLKVVGGKRTVRQRDDDDTMD
jgi:hypothetical protein